MLKYHFHPHSKRANALVELDYTEKFGIFNIRAGNNFDKCKIRHSGPESRMLIKNCNQNRTNRNKFGVKYFESQDNHSSAQQTWTEHNFSDESLFS